MSVIRSFTALTSVSMLISALLLGSYSNAQSAPATAASPGSAPASGASELSTAETKQLLGLPKYALEQCRSGNGFFCDFLSGMLRTIDKSRLPDLFSADLKLDELAERAFDADCSKGLTFGCFQLGMRLKDRSRVGADEEKFQRAVRVCEAACAKKYWPGCLLSLAISQSTDATPQGDARRESALSLACEGGFPPACQYPAPKAFFTALNSGAGLGQLGSASMLWLCNQGHPSHCALLGWSYYMGIPGVKEDRAAALGYFQQACDKGDGMGCQMLGYSTRFGLGTGKDPDAMNRWLTRACELKMGYACMTLGGDLWNAATRKWQDPKQAFKLLTRSCEAENGPGCALLAKMHRVGDGTPRDPAKGKALLEKACRLKFELACQPLSKND